MSTMNGDGLNVKRRGGVAAKLGGAVQGYQSTVDDYDRETARLLGVNETDLRCLEILMATEEAAPSALGTQLGLTTGSVTAMLDRLEKAAFTSRAARTPPTGVAPWCGSPPRPPGGRTP